MKINPTEMADQVLAAIRGYVADAISPLGQKMAALEKSMPERGEKGEKGDPGQDGVNGVNGIDGKDGQDGVSPMNEFAAELGRLLNETEG